MHADMLMLIMFDQIPSHFNFLVAKSIALKVLAKGHIFGFCVTSVMRFIEYCVIW
jgi:hypothetical protein